MFNTIGSHALVASSKTWVMDSLLVVLEVHSGILWKVSLHHLLSNSYTGAFNAPKRQRMYSGLCHVRNRAPFLGGNFGLWGGIFSSMDCLLISYRQKDDWMNAPIAGGITGAILSIRGGATVAFKQGMAGVAILLLIEGVGAIFGQYAARQQHLMM